MTKLPKLVLLAAFPVSLFLYASSLGYYFFQDDWFVLSWVKTGDLLSFLSFKTDIIYWRPLSMPLFFWTTEKLFGLNPFAFHLAAFAIFAALVAAVFELFRVLLKDQKLAAIGAFLYATWSIHFISLSWLSTTSYILGPLFMVISQIFFLRFLKKPNVKSYAASFLAFILAISSTEFALTLAPILAVYTYFFGKKSQIKTLLPFFVVNIIYLALRFAIFPIPARDDYQLVFNFQLVNNFLWYVLWSLGTPESFKYIIFPSLPQQSAKALIQFWQVTIPLALLSVFLAVRIFKNLKKTAKDNMFALLWFSVGISPVIFLPNHSYPLYLSFAGIGYLLLLLNTLKKSANLTLIVLIALWLLTSYNSLHFTKNTHWARNEQAMSKAYTQFTKSQIVNPPDNSVFVFRPANLNFSRENNFNIVEGEDTLRLSLSDQKAMQVIYGNQTIKSIYLAHNQNIDVPKEFYIFEINPAK